MENTSRNLMTAAQVRARFGGISDMSLWRWLNDPAMKFPQPVVIQKRRYWQEAEITGWQQARLMSRAKIAEVA